MSPTQTTTVYPIVSQQKYCPNIAMLKFERTNDFSDWDCESFAELLVSRQMNQHLAEIDALGAENVMIQDIEDRIQISFVIFIEDSNESIVEPSNLFKGIIAAEIQEHINACAELNYHFEELSYIWGD